MEDVGADAFVFCSAELGGQTTKLVARSEVRERAEAGRSSIAAAACRGGARLRSDERRPAGTSDVRRNWSRHGPGELFLGEIREQPEALRRLLDQEADFEAVSARDGRERRPSVVRLVGHGSSDAAASYGVYAFGLLPGWTAMRDSISLTVYYDAKLDLSDPS